MKRFLFVFAILSCITGMAMAQTIVGSSHDLSGPGDGDTPEVCVYCHSSHQATTATAQDPLWNHTLQTLTTTYGVYASATLDATPVEIGNVTAGSASEGTETWRAPTASGPGSRSSSTATVSRTSSTGPSSTWDVAPA